MNTPVRGSISPRNARPLDNYQGIANYRALAKIGIDLDDRAIMQMMHAMDALDPTLTTGSIGTPVQFLQAWLPGYVGVATAVRNIDELIGIQFGGKWSDEEVVQGILENTGKARPYGDKTNMPLASYNTNFERRSIVRFEEGVIVSKLELERAAEMRIDSTAQKRIGAITALEIQRNAVGFYGYNGGANKTYGFLNDPGLPSYVTVATGAGLDTTWESKNFQEITSDIRTAAAALLTRSGGNVNPSKVKTTLGMGLSAYSRLSTTTDFGISVQDWIEKTYMGNMRVVVAPELDAANGGENVFYLYAENVNGHGTDDGAVFTQMVATKSVTLGALQDVKEYREGMSNATAGVMCKRPFAVVRYTGI